MIPMLKLSTKAKYVANPTAHLTEYFGRAKYRTILGTQTTSTKIEITSPSPRPMKIDIKARVNKEKRAP